MDIDYNAKTVSVPEGTTVAEFIGFIFPKLTEKNKKAFVIVMAEKIK